MANKTVTLTLPGIENPVEWLTAQLRLAQGKRHDYISNLRDIADKPEAQITIENQRRDIAAIDEIIKTIKT